jgi:hypothetical protein
VRPLRSELARPIESEKDLNKEVLSVKLEAEPSEIVKEIVRPLRREPANPRESEKDLKNEFFSAIPEDSPNDEIKNLPKLLV